MSNSRLHRSPVDRWIGGVCGGIAETYGWDPVIVRLAVAAL
ncbi:PspC domain-containing protein, partial [Corynebacterium frankenforstense]